MQCLIIHHSPIYLLSIRTVRSHPSSFGDSPTPTVLNQSKGRALGSCKARGRLLDQWDRLSLLVGVGDLASAQASALNRIPLRMLDGEERRKEQTKARVSVGEVRFQTFLSLAGPQLDSRRPGGIGRRRVCDGVPIFVGAPLRGKGITVHHTGRKAPFRFIPRLRLTFGREARSKWRTRGPAN